VSVAKKRTLWLEWHKQSSAHLSASLLLLSTISMAHARLQNLSAAEFLTVGLGSLGRMNERRGATEM
jgi:hypothetical protein